MNKKILRLMFFIIFIILGILVKNNLTSDFDLFVYNFIIKFKSDTLTSMFKIITYMGSTPFIMGLNILILMLILITKKEYLYLFPINSLLSVICNETFKTIFKRVRPSILVLLPEAGYSYPSGHTMISVLFYGTLIILINSLNIKYKKLINIFLMLIILLISISRVYLGVHYITDVIGGYLLALTVIVTKKEILK
ncbi:MAG: phosphatase PAP2 family protein [Erysipelotrichales bacterium]|nr:phosphatase PAP2 family protein [Erysipelotrichales bacterium]